MNFAALLAKVREKGRKKKKLMLRFSFDSICLQIAGVD